MNKLVSIIVPVYNAEKTIKRCLDSLVCQTYSNIEIIVVDNDSDDASFSLIEEYETLDDRIIVLKEKNSGVSNARNKGLNQSRGDYIVFVDADDYLNANAIEVETKEIEKRDVDIVFFEYYIDEKRTKCKKYLEYKKYNVDKYKVIEEMTGGNKYFSSVWRGIYKKDLVSDIRFRNIKFAEDLLFNIEAIMRAENIYISNLANYVYIDNPNSALKTIKDDLQNTIDFTYTLSDIVEETDNDFLKTIYIKEIQNCLYRILNNELMYFSFKKWASKIKVLSLKTDDKLYIKIINKKYLRIYLSLLKNKMKKIK